MFGFVKKVFFTELTILSRFTSVNSLSCMSRTNETRYIEWHEKCKSECKFGANICHNKQRWNNDKCRCECKDLIDKGVCNKRFI